MTRTLHELKVSVRGLAEGMFVSGLDRPWIETSFPLEGLKLQSSEEIENLRRICSYVFVDPARGMMPDLRFVDHDVSNGGNGYVSAELTALRTTQWDLQSDFDSEREVAAEAHGVLARGVEEIMTDLRNGRHLDMSKLKDGVDAMVDSILRNPSAFIWIKEMKRRDDYSYHHALGCAIWAASFGRHLGLEKEEVQKLALGGLLCDVGKAHVPAELLGRPGALTESEMSVVQRHVELGLEIMQDTPGVSPRILEMVATHHERHDGSGYPRQLSGNDIPIYGRILGLVDSYDAMTCVRSHAPSRSPHEAVAELYEKRDIMYQAELVEQFIQTCGIYPTGTLVELSTGEVGVIVVVHSLKRLRPTVMLLLDRDKLPLTQFRRLDLGLVESDDDGLPLTVKSGLPAGAFGIDPKELFLD